MPQSVDSPLRLSLVFLKYCYGRKGEKLSSEFTEIDIDIEVDIDIIYKYRKTISQSFRFLSADILIFRNEKTLPETGSLPSYLVTIPWKVLTQ